MNKFVYIHGNQIVRVYDKGRNKRYGHGTETRLKVLSYDHIDWSGIFVPKGTVTYGGIPVEPTSDISKWNYEVKTTGSSLGGNAKEITKMINSIQQIINKNTEVR